MTATTPESSAFRHDLVLYDGRSQLVDLLAPFLRDGAAVGDHVVVLGEPDLVETLLSAVPELPSVHLMPQSEGERYPGRDLHRLEQTLVRLSGTDAGVRVVNQMPAMTTGRWLEWRRYEAAVNVVLAPYRAWGKCAHDVTKLSPTMLSELTANHPVVETRDGRRPSDAFDPRDADTRDYLDVPPHPLDGTEPTLSLVQPTAADARTVVRDLAIASGLSPTAQESLILATSEVVTNGLVHGRPPVVLRVWVGQEGRMWVAVSDSGSGPPPLVGLVRAASDGAFGGGGLWIVHMLLPEVHHRCGPEGYTITFGVNGEPEASTPTGY